MGIFMLFTNILPEAICCCLQTCNVSSELVWFVSYISLRVESTKEKEEEMNNAENYIFYTFTNHVISSFFDRKCVLMTSSHLCC